METLEEEQSNSFQFSTNSRKIFQVSSLKLQCVDSLCSQIVNHTTSSLNLDNSPWIDTLGNLPEEVTQIFLSRLEQNGLLQLHIFKLFQKCRFTELNLVFFFFPFFFLNKFFFPTKIEFKFSFF